MGSTAHLDALFHLRIFHARQQPGEIGHAAALRQMDQGPQTGVKPRILDTLLLDEVLRRCRDPQSFVCRDRSKGKVCRKRAAGDKTDPEGRHTIVPASAPVFAPVARNQMMTLRQSVIDLMQDVLKDSRKERLPGGLDLEATMHNMDNFFDMIFLYKDSMSFDLQSIDSKIRTEAARSLTELARQASKDLQGDPAEILDDARRALYLTTAESAAPIYDTISKYGVEITLLALALVASVCTSYHIATVNNVDPVVVATSVAEGLSTSTLDYITENPGTIVSSIITKLPAVIA